jgi:tetratricopeptide (TPR) repeat protein
MPERAIPLDLSAALSGYVFSLDMCADAWRCAGVDYGSWAGDWKRALYCAGAGLREQPEAELAAQLLSLAGKSLEELCRFEEASRMRKAAYERSPSPQRLVEWVQCLYEGGFPDEALKLQDKFKENIEKDAHLYQVRALRKIYGDDPGGGMQIILDNAPYGKQTIDDAFILWIGAYILNAEDWRFNFERELMSSPSKRRGWILLDLWEKRKRTDISSYFYETSTWLHTDDAYFAQARDEFNKVKTGPEPQPDPAHILEVLKKAAGMPRTEAWILICNEVKPMLVEWNIKRLLEAGDFDMAEQIASAYEVAGPDQGNMDFKSWIHVLLRRVLAARQRSSLPAVESPAMQESGVK